jgi:polyferredoxin
MGKLGKPSLVTWSSDYEIVERKGKTKYFRPKVIAYMVLLVGIMFALAYMSTTKEHMLLNVNKETRLYAIKHLSDGKFKVENSYIFLLQNTENEPMKFYFDVVPPKGMEGKIKISKPSKPFKVIPGVKKKKIVTLYTQEMLVDNKRKDTIIPIKIHAYALDKDGKPSEKISVYRDTTFVFPKESILLQGK